MKAEWKNNFFIISYGKKPPPRCRSFIGNPYVVFVLRHLSLLKILQVGWILVRLGRERERRKVHSAFCTVYSSYYSGDCHHSLGRKHWLNKEFHSTVPLNKSSSITQISGHQKYTISFVYPHLQINISLNHSYTSYSFRIHFHTDTWPHEA